MDNVLLLFFLLGASADGSTGEAPAAAARVQVVASATILRGEAIRWDEPARRTTAGIGGQGIVIGALRSVGTAQSADGRTIALQEFH